MATKRRLRSENVPGNKKSDQPFHLDVSVSQNDTLHHIISVSYDTGKGFLYVYIVTS